MRAPFAVACAFLSACGGGIAGPATPLPTNGFGPEDRVVIGDFSRVNAIASANDRVYVIYPSAVAIWHPLEQRWDAPRSPVHNHVLRGVSSAITDPVDRSLWMAAGGLWVHYDPFSNRWDDGELYPPAQSVALDAATPGSGAYFSSGGAWQVVPRTGGVATPSQPPRDPRTSSTVADAMRDLPQLRALAPHVATAPGMQQGTLTAAALDPQRQGWFLGTSTRGLVYFDRLAADARPITLGLPGGVIGAVAITENGVNVATSDDGVRLAAVTKLPIDLGVSSPLVQPSVTGPGFRVVWRILAASRGTWLGTDIGALRVSGDGYGYTRYSVSTGLPDDQVTALAEYRGQIVAGTRRGLAVSRGDSGFHALVPTFTDPVYSLLVSGDTLYAGTLRGLFAWLPGNQELRMPEGFRLIAPAAVTILDMGWVADTLVAMTPDRLLWRDPASGGWNEGAELATQLGRLSAFAATARGAWVGGSRGAAFVRPGSPPLWILPVPSQLPAEVSTNGIAVDDRFLWIGTRAGLVRFALTGR